MPRSQASGLGGGGGGSKGKGIEDSTSAAWEGWGGTSYKSPPPPHLEVVTCHLPINLIIRLHTRSP